MKLEKGETEIFVAIRVPIWKASGQALAPAKNAVTLMATHICFFLAIQISCDNKGANLITILSIFGEA